jgi:hypothetical protein
MFFYVAVFAQALAMSDVIIVLDIEYLSEGMRD